VTPGGDRPVLVLTRDPVAERMSEIELTAAEDGLPDG